MKRLILKIIISILTIFSFYGCPSTVPKIEKAEVLKPETVIQVASLNLSNLNKRIERKNITELAKILKNEQIEVLAVQGISRYPGLSSRIDFVTELSTQTDWRNAFGDMLNASGRQTGNAIFSVYPILSQYNQPFDVVRMDYFESALHTTIDTGARSILVVSTQLPTKATLLEQEKCVKTITKSVDNTNRFVIIAGNLPSIDKIQISKQFSEINSTVNPQKLNTKIWFSASEAFKLLNARTLETELGNLVITQLAIYK